MDCKYHCLTHQLNSVKISVLFSYQAILFNMLEESISNLINTLLGKKLSKRSYLLNMSPQSIKSDILTKAISSSRFNELRSNLRVRSLSTLSLRRDVGTEGITWTKANIILNLQLITTMTSCAPPLPRVYHVRANTIGDSPIQSKHTSTLNRGYHHNQLSLVRSRGSYHLHIWL